MPVDGLQRRIAGLLKANRSTESFVGGSSVFNTTFPRRSEDTDIYTHGSIGEVAQKDVATLRGHGLDVDVNDRFYGFCVEAVVRDGEDATKLEWNEADNGRFFPVMPDPTFGWTLHKADLAVKKLLAAATRRKPRDALDVLLIDELYLPMAILAIAAPAKLGAISPTAILDRILLNAMEHPLRDYDSLDLDRGSMPFDIAQIKMLMADRVASTQRVVLDQCPTAVPGHLYVEIGTDRIMMPTPENILRLFALGISERGSVPIIGEPETPTSHWRNGDPYERPRPGDRPQFPQDAANAPDRASPMPKPGVASGTQGRRARARPVATAKKVDGWER